MVLSQWGKRWPAQEAAEGQSSGSDGHLYSSPAPDKSARQQASTSHLAGEVSDEQSRVPSSTAGSPPTAEPPNPTSQGATAHDVTFALTFTRIVSVLMRSIHYKHYTLSDLEWLVVPPMLTGQCAVMETRVNGKPVPVAVALWASVSEQVDKRLSENLATPLKLRPDEWRSGEVLWLVDAVGDSEAIRHLLKQVQQTAFAEREIKIRTLGPDSRPVVGRLKSNAQLIVENSSTS
jgi:hemolysin-activating ACP:hemolysin acyltransferase